MQPGDTLDGYTVLRLIGCGGYGEVWLCRSDAVGDFRALKFIAAADPDRLNREFRAVTAYRKAASRLRSPHLMTIEHVGRNAQGLFYVMPLGDGTGGDPAQPDWRPLSLAALIEQRSGAETWFSCEEIAGWICPVLEALQSLADAGFVHRDVKPANILILGGQPTLADIGLLHEDNDTLTRRGTPGYLTPSWYVGGHPDMYGAAATLYSLLTGNLPDRMGRSAFRAPPQGDQSLTAEEHARRRHFHAVIRRATEERPSERYRDFPAMAQALSGESKNRLSRKYRGLLCAGGLAVILAGICAMSLAQRTRSPLIHRPIAAAEGKRPGGHAAAPEEIPTDAAKKEGAFINSLGMKFVPVPDTDVLFCIHETRWKDYAEYAKANPGIRGDWRSRNFDGFPLAERPEDHPVVNVGRDDALAFCAWLSEKEQKTFRLPTDREWSAAAGLAGKERWRKYDTPESVDKNLDEFPWGRAWPPPSGWGNYSDQSRKAKAPNPLVSYLEDYDDGFPTTAPVMSFAPNQFGLYDLSGNAWEIIADWWNAAETEWVLRGGSWGNHDRSNLASSSRGHVDFWYLLAGFRIVLAAAPGDPAPVLPAAASVPAGRAGEASAIHASEPEAATREKPFENSLGMKFVPVPGTKVLFCVHETRWIDYAAYAQPKPGMDTRWQNQTHDGFHLTGREEEHPVTKVNREDATGFCHWLSQEENRTYRLPTDREWSLAMGLGAKEKWQPGDTPESVPRLPEFPWGTAWPPPRGAGNYDDESRKAMLPHPKSSPDISIEGYDDGFPTTAPVMSFAPNAFGLYDLDGNLREWVEDGWNAAKTEGVLRGGCWADHDPDLLRSTHRVRTRPDDRWAVNGFRVVLEVPDKPEAGH